MMKFFEQLEGLVSSKLATLKTIQSIFKLEARLAGLSVYPLLLNLCMLFVVLITFWLSAMLLIGYFALLYFGSVHLAIILIVFLNLGLLLALLKYLSFNLTNMSFEKTRTYLSSKESNEDDKLKKTINRKNCPTGQNIAMPTNPSDKT
jgi:hypothetical protein